MNFKKCVFLSLLSIFFLGNFSLAQEEIFEQIEEDLEKSRPIEEVKPYPVNLFKAMIDKKNYVFYKEVYFSGRYSSVLRQMEGRNSLGFILFGTFSGPSGQIGDMNIQFRTGYYNNQFAFGQKMPREYTEKINDFEVEIHNFYLRLRALPPMLNVRMGHFYIPFGIQPWIDTHGSLLQSPAMKFTGLDKDWGVAFEGQNDKMEYQLGLTRGSGMEYFGLNNNFVLAGKISTSRVAQHLNDWIGISLMVGKIFDPMAIERLLSFDKAGEAEKYKSNIIKRWRTGIDGQKIVGPARIRFEISGGKDAEQEAILGEFFEIKYILDKNSRWPAYLQFENLTQNISYSNRDSDTTIRLGLGYRFSANYNLQFVVSKDISTIFGEEDTWIGLLFYGQKGSGWLDW